MLHLDHALPKIKGAFKENVEDLDIAMSTYSFLEYSDNYCVASGSLWNYYRHEVTSNANEIFANYLFFFTYIKTHYGERCPMMGELSLET